MPKHNKKYILWVNLVKEKEELYLISKVIGNNKKAIFISAFDKDNKYICRTVFSNS